jgi:hypothetical protein
MEWLRTCPGVGIHGEILIPNAKNKFDSIPEPTSMSRQPGEAESAGPEICPVCKAEYEERTDLDLHVLCMHKCDHCGLLFDDDRSRDAHVERVHGLSFERPLMIDFGPYKIPGWSPIQPVAPKGEAALCQWLFPFCLWLMQRECSVLVISHVPPDLADHSAYFEAHFEIVRKALENVRYRRLTSADAKAKYLARALALPDHGPAYANQKLRRVKFDSDTS